MSSEHYKLSNAKSFADVDWKVSTKTKGDRLIYILQVASQIILISFHLLILKLSREKTLLYAVFLVCFLLCFLPGDMAKV